MARPATTETKYTVFIKVPFPRGTFVDPPTANWNTTKEAELWRMLNSTPKSSGIDWEELAQHFDASPSFLLQQAAWLYERQLSHVREHLSLKHTKQPSTSSTMPLAGAGAQPMRRAGSGQGAGSRAPSSLSVRPKVSSELRRDGPTGEPSTPPQKTRVPYSRTTSTTTITQLQRSPSSHVSPKQRTLSFDHGPGSPLSTTGKNASDNSDKDSSSSDSEPAIVQSRIYARRPRFSMNKGKGKPPLNTLSSADENSDEESPNFLPFSILGEGKDAGKTNETARRRPSTNDGESSTGRVVRGLHTAQQTSLQQQPRPISASSSETLSSPNQSSSPMHSLSSPRDPRSPSEGSRVLSALSPRQRRLAQEGSEGAPSMGSSFSDLDDASISRSAMEEALAREIKAGKGSLGVASRIGGLWRQNTAGSSGGSGNKAPSQ